MHRTTLIIRVAIGRRIKELRKGKGLTQAEIASAAGMSTRTISNIEGARNGAPVETLYQISEKLGIELKDLFEGIGARHRRSPRRIELETRLLDIARTMHDDHLEIAMVVSLDVV